MAHIWKVTINHDDGSNETIEMSSRQMYHRIKKLNRPVDAEKNTANNPHAIYAITYWDNTAILYDEPLQCSDENYETITNGDNVCECYAFHTIEFECLVKDSVVKFKEGNVYVNGGLSPVVYEWENESNRIYAHWYRMDRATNDRIKIDAEGNSFNSIAVSILNKLSK